LALALDYGNDDEQNFEKASSKGVTPLRCFSKRLVNVELSHESNIPITLIEGF